MILEALDVVCYPSPPSESVANTFLAGGVQNSGKKGKVTKDKAKDKELSHTVDSKKEKKSLGIRGIRGFDF